MTSSHLTLMGEDTSQREYLHREVYNGMCHVVRGGIAWRMIPNDLPPWDMVYQQTKRWLRAGVFEAMAHDLWVLLCVEQGCKEQPSVAIFDSRTLQSSSEIDDRTAYDGAKRRKVSKTTIVVDTLDHLLALHVTLAGKQDRTQVTELSPVIQDMPGESVELAFANQDYSGDETYQAAAGYGLCLEVIKPSGTRHGFVLLPLLWVIERSLGWMSYFRRLVCDYEHLPDTLKGLNFLAFAILLLQTIAICL